MIMRTSTILLKHSFMVAGKQLFVGDVIMLARINHAIIYEIYE